MDLLSRTLIKYTKQVGTEDFYDLISETNKFALEIKVMLGLEITYSHGEMTRICPND